jgi:hypothetical protein
MVGADRAQMTVARQDLGPTHFGHGDLPGS